MPTIPFTPPPGFLYDDTSFSSPARYKTGSCVRFVNGQWQVLGGWESLTTSTLTGVCRGVFPWNDNNGYLNIAFGTQQACSRADIEAAARAAHAWDFVQQLPEGLETRIGEDGAKLSGGQRQRIAIARALLKNAPILILDEATSALDTDSERQVQAALSTLMHNRTTLVIAHRLSTIEHADKILVLTQGHIVESGSHAELVVAGGHYTNLNRMQA